MGKGDWYRPFSTTREERDLRHRYSKGEITYWQYEQEYEKLKQKGLIRRDGRIIE